MRVGSPRRGELGMPKGRWAGIFRVFVSLLIFLCLTSVSFAQSPSYYTPESTCRTGFHKTDWHDLGYPYYIQCAPEAQVPTSPPPRPVCSTGLQKDWNRPT